MEGIDLERERIQSEDALLNKSYDFTAKYLAVWHLHHLMETTPQVINSGTISILETALKDAIITHQTQAYFMYKEIANTLCAAIIHSGQLADHALSTLKKLLNTTSGYSHRAVAEALGNLPLRIAGPCLSGTFEETIPCIKWHQICREMYLNISGDPRFIGRSLIARLADHEKLLVIKLAQHWDRPQALQDESRWLEHLGAQARSFPTRFDIPTAFRIRGSYVFRLMEIPVRTPHNIVLHPKGYAIGFITDRDYFMYPNGHRKKNRLAEKEFLEVILRNAWLLGKLASMGIVHSAPIPLFHNRVQKHRRRDHGLYEWKRSGRLDRWLESCSYPNLGLTGIRDFEHFIAFKGEGRLLYRYIGSHFLSLLLIVGSYFRNQDTRRIGFDTHGRPVDARDLFHREILLQSAQGIFTHYYDGFVGAGFKGTVPINLETLSERMIEEMGVDRHMEEVLRIADQKEMTDDAFKDFLKKNGFSRHEIALFRKGTEDISIQSGPHLGEFNHGISLPELIEAVGTMSALCITGRYRREAVMPSH